MVPARGRVEETLTPASASRRLVFSRMPRLAPSHRFLGIAAYPGSTSATFKPDRRFVDWLESQLRSFKNVRLEVTIRPVTQEEVRYRVIRFTSGRK